MNVSKGKHKQSNKKNEHIKRKKKSHKKLVAFISVIILILIVIIFALTAPIFNITDIQIEGNEKISDATIISLSRIEKRRKYI